MGDTVSLREKCLRAWPLPWNMTHPKIFEHHQQVLNDTKNNGNKIKGTKLAGQVIWGMIWGKLGEETGI